MEQTHTSPAAPALRTRVDGWTPDIQSAFIEALAQTGCVRQAAAAVSRAVSGVYRLRARSDAHAFRAAWDAALGLAYARLSEMAMDRVSNGLEQRTYDSDGNLVQRKIVYNDRLLMFLLDHHKPPAGHLYYGDRKPSPLMVDPPSRDDAYGAALAALEDAPAGAGVEPPADPADGPDRFSHLTDEQIVDALQRGHVCDEEDREEIDELERRMAAGEGFDDLMTEEELAEFEDMEDDDDDGAPPP